MIVVRRPAEIYGHMILPERSVWCDATLPEFFAMRFMVISFIKSESFWFPFSSANFNAVDSLQEVSLVRMIRATDLEVERVAMCINHEVSFQAFNLMFSRISYFTIRPLFDFTTEAS